MTKGWNIAVLGATGAVGEALLALLEERQFPINELFLLASERSVGETIRFNGKSYLVEKAEEFDWNCAQLAFFVAGWEASVRYAETAAAAGCVVIDSSSIFAMEADIPLIVPDVNPTALMEYRNRNIIAIASCAVSQLVTSLKPLSDVAGLSHLHVINMVSASTYGKEAVNHLASQAARLLNGMNIEEGFYQRQLAFNILPMVADDKGSVPDERHLVNEVRKILQDPGLPIVVTFIQAPIFYGQAQIVHVEGVRPLSEEEAISLFEDQQDIVIYTQDDYPTPVQDASNSSVLSVGCIRNDVGSPEWLQFWSVTDNIKFGGAMMAVKTAELLVGEYMY